MEEDRKGDILLDHTFPSRLKGLAVLPTKRFIDTRAGRRRPDSQTVFASLYPVEGSSVSGASLVPAFFDLGTHIPRHRPNTQFTFVPNSRALRMDWVPCLL